MRALALNFRVGLGLLQPPHSIEAAKLRAVMLLCDVVDQNLVAVLGLTVRGMQRPIVLGLIRTPAAASPRGCSCA